MMQNTLDIAIANIPKIAPQALIYEVSAQTGQGIKSLSLISRLIVLYSSPSITSSSSSWLNLRI